MKTEVVKTSIGEFTLKEPTAGTRNKVFSTAEQPDGSLKQTVLMTEMIPLCISAHPFDHRTSLRVSLDGMSIADYDMLVDALGKLLNPKPTEDDIKKSNGQSNTERPPLQESQES